MKIKVSVYPIIEELEEKIDQAMRLAKDKRAKRVEIAYGYTSDSIKRRILNILNRKQYRRLYSKLEKSHKGWGRIYVHFRWKDKVKHR